MTFYSQLGKAKLCTSGAAMNKTRGRARDHLGIARSGTLQWITYYSIY